MNCTRSCLPLFEPYCGYTTAPLVHGDVVITEAGSPGGTLAAWDRRTGHCRWLSEARGPAGHSAGLVPMTVEGKPCVAVLTLKGLLVARLDAGSEGKTVGTYDWTTDFANNIPTPAVQGDSVLITSAYNRNAMVRLRVSLSGIEKIWQVGHCSRVCSPVIYKGRIYWAARGLKCVDFATGNLLWEGGRFGDTASCVVTGDGRLVVWANDGDLALAETAERSPAAYKELAARAGLSNTEVWPHVVLAEGRLYCKDRAGKLLCFPL